MLIAVTGATGFLGRYLVRRFVASGHVCRCLHRASSDRTGYGAEASSLEWVEGDLGDGNSARELTSGVDAVVHAALDRPGAGFRGAEGDVVEFARLNVLGTLGLIEAARAASVDRFVFVSTCAVHEKILEDRPLDETHPCWATSHYGAHKAAIEMFVHSYGYGAGYPICALRPTGIYGVAHPVEHSKWFGLIHDVVQGRPVHCQRGGKEVHAADVARAVELLLLSAADQITGHAFNCYDRYISEYEVAQLARDLSGSGAEIHGQLTHPRNQIDTGRLRGLGMQFGGLPLLRETIADLVAAVGRPSGSS